MKKFIYVLLFGMMLLIPSSMYAHKAYSIVKVSTTTDPSFPSPTPPPYRPKSVAISSVSVSIDEYSGDLFIAINKSIENVHITISYNGMSIEDDTLSAIYGQSIMYNMSTYEDGVYYLTIEGDGNVLSKYKIMIFDE